MIKILFRRLKEERGRVWSFKDEPNRHIVVIDPRLGRIAALRTIAHEITHIMQFMDGKMKVVGKKKVMWGSRIMDESEDYAKYMSHPWEIQARSMETKLTNAYLRHIRKLKKEIYNRR